MARLRPTSTLSEWIDRLLGTLRARRADAAALPPALRAARIDPAQTLRAE